MEFEKTSVEISGLTIMEPVTSLTDLIVSAVCMYAFFKIHRSAHHSGHIFSFYKYYFLTMAVSTAYGGIIGHAFQHLLGFSWKVPGWIIGMGSITLIERATIMHARPYIKPATGNFFLALNLAELIALTFIVLYTMNFFFVEAHAAYGLLVVVFSFELFVFIKTKDKGSRLFLIAVGISGLAALVHLTGFTAHTWFNHLDLSHVLMSIAAWFYYKGATSMVHSSSLRQAQGKVRSS